MSPLFSNQFIVALVAPSRKIVFGSRRIDSSVKSMSATDVMFFRKEGLTILLEIFLPKRSIDDFNMCNVGSSRWSSKLKFLKIEIVAWVNFFKTLIAHFPNDNQRAERFFKQHDIPGCKSQNIPTASLSVLCSCQTSNSYPHIHLQRLNQCICWMHHEHCLLLYEQGGKGSH